MANYVGKCFNIVSVYLFVPLYLKYLGIEAYGLVGFYTSMLGVLALGDLGLTATMNRELARLSVEENSKSQMNSLVRTIELLYFIMTATIGLLVWFSAPILAEYWIKSNIISIIEVNSSIRLMGFAISLQLIFGLYIGGLTGLEKQVKTNIILVACSIFRGVGGVLVLKCYSPTIYAFAVWQLISNTIFALISRHMLWRSLPSINTNMHIGFNFKALQSIWNYTAGMAGIALITIILTQTDKILVSKMLSLTDLGYYTLAGTLASIPTALTGPLATAVFPRFNGLVAKNDYRALNLLYNQFTQLVGMIIIPAGFTMILFSKDLVFAWTGSLETAIKVETLARVLLLGQLLQAIMILPYYISLAHGDTKLNMHLWCLSVIAIIPLLIVLIKYFGIMGAGISWLVINLSTVFVFLYKTHKKYLNINTFVWFKQSILMPCLISFPIIIIFRSITEKPINRAKTICIVILILLIVEILTFISLFPSFRNKKCFFEKTI